MSPPHAGHNVLLTEVVGDADIFAEIDALKGKLEKTVEGNSEKNTLRDNVA